MDENDTERNGIHLFRQLVISCGSWSLYFMLGLCFGTPTVLVPQLRKENMTISEDMASWLRSNSILLSQILLGPLAASHLTVSVVAITEYTASKYRGLFLTIKSASFFWGVVVANCLGTFFHWRVTGIVGILCALYNIVSLLIWPESPYWLASKRKFDDCAKSHRWLKGADKDSELELNRLIQANEIKVKVSVSFKSLTRTMFSKKFAKPVMLAILMTCLYSFSGKMFCTVFALDMLKKITNNESTAYTGMLILDGVTVISMYLGCSLAKILKRRTMLLSFSSIGVGFLLLMSSYMFLIDRLVVSENKYVSIALLAGYSISISLGPIILSTSIIGELLPAESKSLSMCVIALVFKLVFGTFLKITPYCFKYLRMYGTFLLYAVLSIGCLILIYFFIPETKDKTLLDIDDAIKNRKKVKTDEVSQLMEKNCE